MAPSRRGVLLSAPVLLSAREPAFPIFDCPTRTRPFHAALLTPERRAAYDHTARLLLLFALLEEEHRAAHALWAVGVPVPRAMAGTPCLLGSDLNSRRKWEGNPEEAWYNAVQARLCLAVLDLIIIAAGS